MTTTIEQWLTVNNSNDWFEIGYTDGLTFADNTYYKGFFQGSLIHGYFYEVKFSDVTATVGSLCKFEISDFNRDNTWDIYIGTSYLGTFADSISACVGNYDSQGYEANYDISTLPVLSPTYISSQNYYAEDGDDFDNDGNTTEWIWKGIYNRGVSIEDIFIQEEYTVTIARLVIQT